MKDFIQDVFYKIQKSSVKITRCYVTKENVDFLLRIKVTTFRNENNMFFLSALFKLMEGTALKAAVTLPF